MSKAKIAAFIAAPVLLVGAVTGGAALYNGEQNDNEFNRFNGDEVDVSAQGAQDLAKLVAGERADIDINGKGVDNIRQDADDQGTSFCSTSNLAPGEGFADKGNKCVSTPIGEVAENPVKVTVTNPPSIVKEGDDLTLKVRVEDKFGPLDLNAFTFDKSGGAGDTLLEHPAELDANGRPLLHGHIGVATLDSKNGLPVANDYDAAFSGVQGVNSAELTVDIAPLEEGFYKADLWFSAPGHPILPTASASDIQAIHSFNFEVSK